MSRGQLQVKLLVGVDPAPGFDPAMQIAGDNGSNLEFISRETGADVTVRGRNSRFIEPRTGRESSDPLHVFIQHEFDHGAMERACKLVKDLIETVKEDRMKLKQAYQKNFNSKGEGSSGLYGNREEQMDAPRREINLYQEDDWSGGRNLQQSRKTIGNSSLYSLDLRDELYPKNQATNSWSDRKDGQPSEKRRQGEVNTANWNDPYRQENRSNDSNYENRQQGAMIGQAKKSRWDTASSLTAPQEMDNVLGMVLDQKNKIENKLSSSLNKVAEENVKRNQNDLSSSRSSLNIGNPLQLSKEELSRLDHNQLLQVSQMQQDLLKDMAARAAQSASSGQLLPTPVVPPFMVNSLPNIGPPNPFAGMPIPSPTNLPLMPPLPNTFPSQSNLPLGIIPTLPPFQMPPQFSTEKKLYADDSSKGNLYQGNVRSGESSSYVSPCEPFQPSKPESSRDSGTKQLNNRIPSPQGFYSPNMQNSVPPNKNYAPFPPQKDFPPKQNYGSSQRSYSPSKQSYSPPQRNQSIPKQNYDGPMQNYASSQRNFSPPKQNYATPRDFSPERNYAPSKRGLSPPMQKYGSLQEDDYSPYKYDAPPSSYDGHERYSPQLEDSAENYQRRSVDRRTSSPEHQRKRATKFRVAIIDQDMEVLSRSDAEEIEYLIKEENKRWSDIKGYIEYSGLVSHDRIFVANTSTEELMHWMISTITYLRGSCKTFKMFPYDHIYNKYNVRLVLGPQLMANRRHPNDVIREIENSNPGIYTNLWKLLSSSMNKDKTIIVLVTVDYLSYLWLECHNQKVKFGKSFVKVILENSD